MNGLAAGSMRAEEHMDRAVRNLEAARSNKDSGFFEVALNRWYYAAFESAHAALRALSLPLPNNHGGLASEFGRHAIKEGPVPKEAGQLLMRLGQGRLVADYEGAVPTREDAEESLALAESCREANPIHTRPFRQTCA